MEEEEKGGREEGVGSMAERESEERSWRRRRRRRRERRRSRVGAKVLIVCSYLGPILEPIRGTITCAGTLILRPTVLVSSNK